VLPTFTVLKYLEMGTMEQTRKMTTFKCPFSLSQVTVSFLLILWFTRVLLVQRKSMLCVRM
jgi:hypothetical protein